MRLHIFGKVHGVFYRQSARKMAESLNLSGWVKNLTDGSVLIEVEGHSDGINAFASWCKTGPPRARVDSVEVEWLEQQTGRSANREEKRPGFKVID